MRIYPAVHYTMGGLWVDYNLMSNLSGLHVVGEANFSDHGANRLGASALMQGLADGYFVIPSTIANYLYGGVPGSVSVDAPEFLEAEKGVRERADKLLNTGGTLDVSHFHRELGLLMWNHCGMERDAAGLRTALEKIPQLRERFWKEVRVPGSGSNFNQQMEMAGRVADFLEFAEVMCYDALEREESCGGHFRNEFQTPEGEALRRDEEFAHVAAWEHAGVGNEPILHKEKLEYENVHFTTRSYK